MSERSARDEPALLLAWERLTEELMRDTRRFDANFRHNLARYVNTALLDGLCALAEVPYQRAPERIRRLNELDGTLARLRVLVRQCYIQRALGERRYAHHQASINEIGKMLGGWLRFLRGELEREADER